MVQTSNTGATANVIPGFSSTIPGQMGYPEFNFMNSASEGLNGGLMPQTPLMLQNDYSLYSAFGAAGNLAFTGSAFDDVSLTSIHELK